MSIIIDPDLEREIEARARAQGYDSPSTYLRRLLQKEQARESDVQTRGERFVERLRGTSTSELSTEQTMDLTRSDA